MLLLTILITSMLLAPGPSFEEIFEDATLRLDYTMCGDASHTEIYLADMQKTGPWAGRRSNLDQPLLRGDCQIVLKADDGTVLYANSFSTLFREWQQTAEAKERPRAYENCIQVPFPKKPVTAELTVTDIHGKVTASLMHRVDPEDILIRKAKPALNHVRSILESAPAANAIDIVVLSEGYTLEQEEKFFADAARLVRDSLFATAPYTALKDKFNIRAVFAPSQDEGPSIPHEGKWNATAANSHYDTFYSERYLTSSSMRKIYGQLGTVPFEHVIVLVNTPLYGGGGIFNSVTLASSDHPSSGIVFVHEFGHAFAGLADEYAYDEFEPMYSPDTEPWEPNITTLKDFGSKWADMLPGGTPVPTPPSHDMPYFEVRRSWNQLDIGLKKELTGKLGVFEGAGNSSKGVYRPVQECRMRMNECESFCPVCQRAIARTIDYYTR